MCLCTLCSDRFLRSVDHSEVFHAYCRSRQLSFTSAGPASPPTHAVQRWLASLAELPEPLREQVEWELAAVNELTTSAGTLHLLAAAVGGDWHAGEVPVGGSLALSILLRRPDLFHEVFFNHENRDLDVWHTMKASPPGMPMPDPARVASSLAETLGEVFTEQHEVTRRCTVDVHRLPAALCFVARAPSPRRWVERVVASGPAATPSLPLTMAIHFIYYPEDGTILLHSPAHSGDLMRDFLVYFSGAILGFPIDGTGGGFSLDRLRFPFHPLSLGDDMELVRVKALHLCSPGRAGRRHLQLETLASDDASAMDDLLRTHARDLELSEVRVTYAELQIRLRIAGRNKNHLVRLWPDRCDLGRGALGDHVLACLRRWGL